jgi:hypothetical protein
MLIAITTYPEVYCLLMLFSSAPCFPFWQFETYLGAGIHVVLGCYLLPEQHSLCITLPIVQPWQGTAIRVWDVFGTFKELAGAPNIVITEHNQGAHVGHEFTSRLVPHLK